MEELPEHWEKQFEKTTYHSQMDREYTRIAYVSENNTVLRISDVQEPNSFGGWGYLVRTDEQGSKPLGLVESLDEAKKIALTYMQEHIPMKA